ncbi:transposase [Aquiflexum sp. TKW24L]|uniref:transposase n=1 Tax=Aquiflexum sp. TKW24L TaxID=2942212 RepID=UPI0020C0FCD2|nr:transposase [Aquiflexum sp. TKW24L]MCL6258049.1 transposase [Aquiflexum sp. TKW24L]
MDKYKNKYRIPSARLQHWDYGANGAYFITICTQDRQCFFGDIAGNPQSMKLNTIGQLAEQFWMEIPNHFPFVELGNFVVMPNHVHGILIIDRGETPMEKTPIVETPNLGVSTGPPPTPSPSPSHGGKNDKWNPGTIGVIINQYKRMVTIHARKIHADFGWQSRFHDHIIRNAQSFETIQSYIETNPLNWEKDKFYG